MTSLQARISQVIFTEKGCGKQLPFVPRQLTHHWQCMALDDLVLLIPLMNDQAGQELILPRHLEQLSLGRPQRALVQFDFVMALFVLGM